MRTQHLSGIRVAGKRPCAHATAHVSASRRKGLRPEASPTRPDTRKHPRAPPFHQSLSIDAEPQAADYSDKIAKQCALLRAHFKLSERETEIVEALARGSTAPAMAKTFGVSENTVKTHMKRIYSKLGIHRKGELIDLVNSFDPKALA